MALVKCKECRKKVSTKAQSCPHCGAPVEAPKKTSLGKQFLAALFVFAVFVYVGSSFEAVSPSNNRPPATAKPSAITVSSTDVGKPWSGDKWPFTVSSGTLKCDRDAVIFVVGGRTYAVNGTAGSRGFTDIAPIWRDNAAIPGTKIYIGVVLDPGLKLCN